MHHRLLTWYRNWSPRTLGLPGALAEVPVPARLWWAAVVLLAVATLPWCLLVDQPRPDLAIAVLVALGNATLEITTSHRQRSATGVTFDYGGVASVTLLVFAGPTAALIAHAGQSLAAALVRNDVGQRPSWRRSVYNTAWAVPVLACGWAACLLVQDITWGALLAGVIWWQGNAFMIGTVVALNQGRAWIDGARLAFTQDGWLGVQEAVLVLLSVVVWRTNPWLVGAIGLLLLTHAITTRRLLREFEAAAEARQAVEVQRQRAELEATRARHDPLTQLPNRHALEEKLSRPPNGPALLMIDLDHFKRINDRHGHDAGDRVLVEVARAIREALRPADFCARLGGEEFCAVLADIETDDQLCVIAERVREAVHRVRLDSYPSLAVSMSIGAVRVPHGLRPADAIPYADRALYVANGRGRDRVQVYLEGEVPLAA
jgi:diguanylate cyclase (GGDEF)-like protein